MELVVTESGSVFLPEILLRRSGISIGETVNIQIVDGEILITKRKMKSRKQPNAAHVAVR